MDKALRVSVPIMLQGEAAGVKTEGGIMEQMLREVEIECLPGDIPSHIDVDVSHLTFGKVLRVSDLPHTERLKFLTDANQPVAHVDQREGRSCGHAGSGGGGSGAAPAEPEVIKKGKQETEEEAPKLRREAGKEGREEGEEIDSVVAGRQLRCASGRAS